MLFHPVLATLTPEDRNSFIQKCSLLRVEKNGVLLERGSPYSDYYVVAAGLFRVEVPGTADGSRATVGFEAKGAILGEVIQKRRYVSSLTATAVMAGEVFAVPTHVVHDLMLSHPGVVLSMYLRTGEIVQKQRRQIARLIGAPPEEAVGKALFELALILGNGDTRVMDKRVTQGTLASYLGMSREQVNKTIKILESRGLVEKTDEGYAVSGVFGPTDFQSL